MRHPSYKLNDHLTRYKQLGDYFIDREMSVSLRYFREHPYEVWLSGASPTGIALCIGSARTLEAAIAIARQSANTPRLPR